MLLLILMDFVFPHILQENFMSNFGGHKCMVIIIFWGKGVEGHVPPSPWFHHLCTVTNLAIFCHGEQFILQGCSHLGVIYRVHSEYIYTKRLNSLVCVLLMQMYYSITMVVLLSCNLLFIAAVYMYYKTLSQSESLKMMWT